MPSQWRRNCGPQRQPPYQLSVTTFEPQFGGPTKTYNFDLKDDRGDALYDMLWAEVYRPTLPASPGDERHAQAAQPQWSEPCLGADRLNLYAAKYRGTGRTGVIIMSPNHHSAMNHSREQKRAQFADQPQQKAGTNAVAMIIIAALACVGAYLVMGGLTNRPAVTSVAPTQARATPANANAADKAGAATTEEIAIPVADVSDGKAKFFDYAASDGRSVRFFVIKSSDGVYRAALDACDVCFAGKKGYHQEGDAMICNKCGRQFPSALVNEVTGGCNPIGLPRALAGDRLVIKASELESRKSYF